MENEFHKQLDALNQKIDAIYFSVEKTRKYFFWTMVITFVVVILPVVGLLFAIPAFLNNYVGGIQGIGGL